MKLLLVCCLVPVVLGEFNVKFNQLLDGQIAAVTQALSQANVHNIPLPDQTIQGATIKNALIGDVTTLYRIGDANMIAKDDSTLEVSTTIGLKDMKYYVGSYSSPKYNYDNATFTIATNSLSWDYTIAFTPTGGCSMTISKLEISSLDGVTMYSSDPKMNNIDVSKQFQVVKNTMNNFIKTPQFQAILKQHDPCASTQALSNLFSIFM